MELSGDLIRFKVLQAAAEHERLAEACEELPVDLDDPDAFLPPTRPEDMARVAASLASMRLVSVTEDEHRLDYWAGIGAAQEAANWSSGRLGLALTVSGQEAWRASREAWMAARREP